MGEIYTFSETGYPCNRLDSVQQQLTDYDGHDPWGDVILQLDGYDEGATDKVDPRMTGNRFVIAGVVYTWRPDLLDGIWRASYAADGLLATEH